MHQRPESARISQKSQTAVPSMSMSSTGAWGRRACVIMCVRACVRAVCVCVRVHVCVYGVCVCGGGGACAPAHVCLHACAGRVCLGVHVCGPECNPTNK